MANDPIIVKDPQTPEIKKVEMTQEEFDAKFNTSFGKGAAKANADLLSELGVENLDSLKAILKAKTDADEAAKTELEKALEVAEALKKEKDELNSKYEKSESKNLLTSLAAKHGVKEVDYFELELSKVQRGDDFNMDNFIATLKESKPALFGVVKPANTDKTPGGGDSPDFKSKLKGLSFQELQKLQQSL